MNGATLWTQEATELVAPFWTEAVPLCDSCAEAISARNVSRAKVVLPIFLEGRDLGAELDALENDGWPEFEEFLRRARLLDEAEPVWWIESKTSRRWRLDLSSFSLDYARGTDLDLVKGAGGSWTVKQVRFDAP